MKWMRYKKRRDQEERIKRNKEWRRRPEAHDKMLQKRRRHELVLLTLTIMTTEVLIILYYVLDILQMSLMRAKHIQKKTWYLLTMNLWNSLSDGSIKSFLIIHVIYHGITRLPNVSVFKTGRSKSYYWI